MHNETNLCHTGHQNSSGLGQARAGKHVGLVTPARTIMSLLFSCNGSSQRSVSTVVLIKPQHLPVVSGTWHFPGRSMCCTHTLPLWGFWEASSCTATPCRLLTPTSLICTWLIAHWRTLCSVWAQLVQSFQEAQSCGLQKELGFLGAVQVWSVYFLWAILSSSLLFLLGKEILEKYKKSSDFYQKLYPSEKHAYFYVKTDVKYLKLLHIC